MDSETNERLRELDTEGILALREAAREYHAKHSRGSGGARVCVCGQGNGGSTACRGYAIIRDLFRYANFDDPAWRERFEMVREIIS